MPNIKAPEYYEVTGESPPKMPIVDENELMRIVPKGKGVRGLKKAAEKAARDAEEALVTPGFQDRWKEGGELDADEVEELEEISTLSARGGGCCSGCS